MIFRRTSWALLLALLVAGGLATACAKNPETTPAVEGAGPGVGTGGQFVWHELITDDPVASRRFYGELLGWEFQQTSRLGKPYSLALVGDRHVGGIVGVDRKPSDEPISQWVSYMLVTDIDQATGAIKRGGGRVLVEPVGLGTDSRAALVVDSQGAPLGLLQTPEDLSSALEGAVPNGGFLWRDYLALDVEAALGFYADFAGFGRERQNDNINHYLLKQGRGGAGLVPIENAPVESNWLPYVRVEDAAAMARRTKELGGEVLLAPSPEIRNGELTIVADPSGAALALVEWTQ
jgi:predicted enzyme related to lactoylglutathione lyase